MATGSQNCEAEQAQHNTEISTAFHNYSLDKLCCEDHFVCFIFYETDVKPTKEKSYLMESAPFHLAVDMGRSHLPFRGCGSYSFLLLPPHSPVTEIRSKL